MPIEKGNFVEIAYTGKLKEDGLVFDTTHADIAKEANIHDEQTSYGPVIICVGERQIVEGVDDALVGREAGNFERDIAPEKAFGRKDPSQIQMIPTQKFAQQKVKPFPGLQLNVDGRRGTVKIVTGGRILVDFNHPLAGKAVHYEISVKRIVHGTQEQVEAVLKMFRLPGEVAIEEKKATITLPQALPEQASTPICETIKRLVKLDDVVFAVKS